MPLENDRGSKAAEFVAKMNVDSAHQQAMEEKEKDAAKKKEEEEKKADAS